MGLDDDLALRPVGDDSLEGRIDPTWWTPRGPLGGYVMALMHQAMRSVVEDPARQTRSLTVNFTRTPKEGPVVLRPRLERSGRSLSTVTARLEQDGELLGLAIGSFSGPWPGPELSESPMPEVEPPEGRDVLAVDLPGREPPPFTQQLTMQHRIGAPFFSKADRAETGGWLGLREEREVDAATVLVLADAWFPAPWPRLDALAPAPTIEMSVYFRAPLPQPDSLLLGRFRTRLIRDGFFEEDGALWTPDGTLIAQSRQIGLLLAPR
jgi:acyl-CoA thioesterase